MVQSDSLDTCVYSFLILLMIIWLAENNHLEIA